ncbi:hypothetical protein D0Y60_02210 [Shinella sp. WSJ-2]|uniref:hypothetical protein n=1 Tax=Shinella sp. WSJ-2 TaxID=2303749 RepID=UPI000E3EBF10|nr:hypothetical protein [Shinella sp. WSJ-2]MBO9628455.1 hypothetical protein [Shinella sp.]RFZ89457.1 hypothetical protein D0Y60_02210 [Shinella sp. WSJ-2]
MQPNSVTLICDKDDWIVIVMENGEELQRSFKMQAHAQSWCDGQRVRLGLPADYVPATFEFDQ